MRGSGGTWPSKMQLLMALFGAGLFWLALGHDQLSMLPHAAGHSEYGYIQYAERLRATLGYSDPYWPPLYPLLMLAVEPLAGDLFLAGRLISVAAAVGCLWVAYRLGDHLFDRESGRCVGPLAALVLPCGTVFVSHSITVNSDLTFTFLFSAALLTGLWAQREGATRWWLVCGLLSGLAFGVRHAGAAVAIGFALELLWRQGSRRGLALLCAGAAVAAAPVLVSTWATFGSPLYNLHHHSMAGAIYGGGDLNRFFHGGHTAAFPSLADVLLRSPAQVLRYAIGNVGDLAQGLVFRVVGGVLGALALLGLLTSDEERRRTAPALWPVLIYLAGIILFVPMIRYLLPLAPLVAAFAAGALCRLPRRARAVAGPAVLAAALLTCGQVGANIRAGQTDRYERIGARLRTHPGGRLMATHGYFYGFYSGKEGLMLPRDPPSGRQAATRWLKRLLEQRRVDLLVVDSDLTREVPGLLALRLQDTPPDFLLPVLEAPELGVVVFQVAGR